MTVNFGVNYLAILVAAIAAVAIGIVYYGVLGVGDRQSQMLGASPVRPGPIQGATGVVVGLVNAWVIAVLSLSLGAASIIDAISLGALVWLGFGISWSQAFWWLDLAPSPRDSVKYFSLQFRSVLPPK